MQIKLEKFEGPLDLLLKLIQKNKLDISEISLSKIANQYFNFIQKNQQIPFANLIYFLDIANRLLMYKTQSLLPYLNQLEEEEQSEDLVRMLAQYQKYLKLAKRLQKRYQIGQTNFCRQQRIKNQVINFKKITPKKIEKQMQKIIKKITPKIQQARLKKIINIQERIAEINQYLKNKKICLFSDLCDSNSLKTEVIINLLAILELNKNKFIYVKQEENFQEIYLEKTF